MDNLNLIKGFLLRRQELLSLIRPFCLIQLLDEIKADVLEMRTQKTTLSASKNNLDSARIDVGAQNLAGLAKDFYQSRLEETKERMDLLESQALSLKRKLNFNTDFPIYTEKSTFFRTAEIEWIFDLIDDRSNLFKGKLFESLKCLIFGELIKINRQLISADRKSLQITRKHFRDFQISTGQIKKPEYDAKSLTIIENAKKAFVEAGMKEYLDSFDDEVYTLEYLKKFYGFNVDSPQSLKELGQKLQNYIKNIEDKILGIESENSFYLTLILNFEDYAVQWEKSWIDREIPVEDYF